MNPVYTFQGNGSGGSVALKIFSNYVEYEHKNYFAIVPLDKVLNVSYSKDEDPVYAQVSIGGIDFGCDNKAEVYEAMRQVLSAK